MDSIQIPGLAALRSTDAVVIRQITLSIVEELSSLRKEIEELKKRPVPKKDNQYKFKGNF